MRKVVVSVYTSLDGIIQPLDWMPPSEGGREERGNYARDLLFASDALLLGRETYEIFAKTWPSRTAADACISCSIAARSLACALPLAR
jgi:dihydrofolate reductase